LARAYNGKIDERNFLEDSGAMKKEMLFILSFFALVVSIGALDASEASEFEAGWPDSVVVAAAGDGQAPDSIRVMYKSGKERGVYVVRESKDTVFVLRTGAAKTIAEDSRKAARKITEKGYGFAGVVLQGAAAVNIEPVAEMLSYVLPSRAKFQFNDFSYEPMYLTGGMGYVGVGNGIRLGGGGMRGNRRFASAFFSGDSVVSMDLAVRFGGFCLEKVIYASKNTFIAGGSLGGGGMKTGLAILDQESYSPFRPSAEEVEPIEYKASFLYTELHGGATHTLLPLLHLGLDIFIPVFFSADGFAPSIPSSSFLTVNPVIRARIVFGNLG